MNWTDVCSDNALQDLPYKVELDEWGQIVMRPASVRHVALQDAIASLLKELLKKVSRQGRVLQEFPVQIEDSVRVPDVVWISEDKFQRVKDQIASPLAPEICVEVLSPGNTTARMARKKSRYFHAGVREVWTCDKTGAMAFFARSGELGRSNLVPDFPGWVGEL
uniref:Restriction endonuclease n=1 Tax=Candidatus Kentrum sp. FM TaxID=2126340 RepID=A0A450TBC0_9GAMM|nr:MAG: Putative restriction endonuclease [Candidatus Kentron sp. FM]